VESTEPKSDVRGPTSDVRTADFGTRTTDLGRRASDLGLYLHIPFCSAICNYCNFNRGLYDEALKTRYVAALREEIARAESGPADTIFFGGGTPSLLQPDEVGAIIQSCRERFDSPQLPALSEAGRESGRVAAVRRPGTTGRRNSVD